MAEKLTAIGVPETERNLANKISRGGFTAAFFIPMPCRRWLPHVAVRGFGVAVALCWGITVAQSQGEPESNPKPAQTQSDQTTADQTGPAPSAEQSQPVIVAEQQKPHAGPYDPGCEKPKGREDADLCEQRRMAKAAEDAVWWARLQTGLGILGFCAVLLSLFFTGWAAVAAAQAAKAANKSADAADGTLKAMQDTAESQLRAYLSVDLKGCRRGSGWN